MMTFNEFITSRRVVDNPYGDFIKQAQGDQCFPAIENWEQIVEYIRDRRLRRGATAAALTVWRHYLSKTRLN
ncbi:conserved hypothetical protein [Mesorhizobium escarrei]|uniref:YozE SAM-like domain-containing protein n=1 Tax=Mesorhizobium escarrei TaxID=666018 RepID=A0ABN8K2K2_9HYPH|nr:conserved hypothetical protein [Mesorhizobium escarrei]